MVVGVGLLVVGMDTSVSCLSPQLLAANRRLHELRAQVRAQRQAAGDERYSVNSDQYAVKDTAGCSSLITDNGSLPTELPEHLGWESAAVTAVLRRQQRETCLDDGQQNGIVGGQKTAVVKSFATINNRKRIPSKNNPQSAIRNPQSGDWVKLYPTIGLGMLRAEMTAPGRLWLMLHYLDREGRGVLRIANTSKLLTSNSSTLRLCGKRQLRNLLRDGEGVFWVRDKERIWLRSAAKVAYALGVERLAGRPVDLPVAALLEGIGTFRAHLYAAFHSSRTKVTPPGTHGTGSERSRGAMPIARDTLAGLSGVGQSSQRAYEARLGLTVQANFAVGEVSTEENQEKSAWQQGQALFALRDYRGEQGKKGKEYLAWQMPNSYGGQHQQRPFGRQKRINRELKDLVMKGMPGNVEGTSETQQPVPVAKALSTVAEPVLSTSPDSAQALSQGKVKRPEKVYFPNGKLAVKACSRQPERALYWRRHRTAGSRFDLWQQLRGR